MPFDRRFDRHRKGLVIGDEYCLCRAVVLRLRQQIGGNPLRIVAPIGKDENFRGTGNHVDSYPAKDAALCCGDVGISRTDNLVDGRDCRGAVGERRYRLGSAHSIHFLYADHPSRRQYEWIEDPARRRHGHHQPLDAGDFGGNGVHQH